MFRLRFGETRLHRRSSEAIRSRHIQAVFIRVLGYFRGLGCFFLESVENGTIIFVVMRFVDSTDI